MGSGQMWWSASPPSPWGRGAGKGWALGGPLAVKAVGFLLLAGLLFRVLCSFPSSPAPALQIAQGPSDIHFLEMVYKSALVALLNALIQSYFPGEEPVDVYHDKEFKNRRWHFKSYNFTVSLIWAPFLIKSDVFENENGESTSEIQLHLDTLDASWTSQYESFDYVIISGGQWFLRTAVYWENGAVVGCHYCQNKSLLELGFEHLYRKTLQSVFNFIISAKHKPVIFFRTWSPDHFENGEWFNGGSCNRVTPYKKGEHREGYNGRVMREIELKEFSKAAAALRGSPDVERLKLMDTYSLSSLRPDGHVGPYRTPYPFAKDSKNTARVQNDCLHWCVPGPIDAWNNLVMKMALDQ
nr:unnamed protein product [Digitaria exilis]